MWKMKLVEVMRNNDRLLLTVALLFNDVEKGQTALRWDGNELPATAALFLAELKVKIEPFRASLAAAVKVAEGLTVGSTVNL